MNFSRYKRLTRWVFTIFVFGLITGLMGCVGHAEAESRGADEVFDQYKDQVVQIRIIEASSGSKSTVGSGFLVSSQGHIMTNYHVVAKLIHKPDQYNAEIIHYDGYKSSLNLLSFDAIHDLAVVQTDRSQSSFFQFQINPIKKGTKVYSMGNPWDLGMTVVEGTHSGLLEHTLYEKIHFTGSLNAGMSGGPTVTSEGRIVGVNVSSAGNQMSFLVPAAFAQNLLGQPISEEEGEQPSLLLKLRDQLVQHQDEYLSNILSQEWPITTLGHYNVPSEIASFVKCWGSSAQPKKLLYVTVTKTCSFEDGIYLSQSLYSGTLKFTHTYISSEQLNRFRFYGLYQGHFQSTIPDDPEMWFDDEEELGSFSCLDDFVDQEFITMKVVICLRGYKKLPGLYDSVLKVATLDNNHMGIQSTVTLTGVTFEKAKLFSRKFLMSIGPKR